MRFIRLKADGFGCLRGEYRFPEERLTLLVDENERGKSVGSSRVDLQACKLEYSIVSPK